MARLRLYNSLNNKKEELTRPAVVPKGGPLYNDPEVAEAIGLTEQQAEELRKVHEFAIKRCGEVMNNGKLTEEQKQKEIGQLMAKKMPAIIHLIRLIIVYSYSLQILSYFC